MKKIGFTLAEILIVMSIIGIVAALTLPTFMVSTRNKANAAKLAATLSDVENAFTTMIVSEAVEDITQTPFWKNLFNESTDLKAAASLAKYLKIDASGREPDDYYGDEETYFKYLDDTNAPCQPNHYFHTTNGALLIVDGTPKDKSNNDAEEQKTVSELIIDVNSSDAPNVVGRDVFYFALGKNGKLYPYGSKTFSLINKGNTNHTWDKNEGNYPCTDTSKKRGCTARLIENGFKMDY